MKQKGERAAGEGACAVDILDVLTKGAAVWGVELTTVLAVQHARQQRRERKPRLKVSLELVSTQSIPGDPFHVHLYVPRPSDPKPHYLSLKVENSGQRAIRLDAMGLLPPNGDFFTMPLPPRNSPFPRRLEPSEACLDTWPAKEVAINLRDAGCKGAIRLGGCYVDGLSNRYLATPLDFDVDAWATDTGT